MPFFIRVEELGAPHPSPAQRLFADYWLSVLESRVPMSIGPQPFSVLSLLESIKTVLAEGQLRPGTVSTQVQTVISLIQSRPWLRSTYPKVDVLQNTLTALTHDADARNVQQSISAVDQLFEFLAGQRVSSHVDFILSRRDDQIPAAAAELGDLIADLIAIGHSESFLYGWGRAVLLAQNPQVPAGTLEDRLDKFRLLGTSRKFQVVFRVRKAGFLPHSDVLTFGKGVMRAFKTLQPFTFGPGETGALCRIEAPDYKAAIARAVTLLARYRNSLAYSKKVEKLDLAGGDFAVRCEDDDTELVVPREDVRPYEPPPLINGNAVWICRTRSPAIVNVLEQVLYWLGSSRDATGESEFLNLWLSLVSLHQSERVSDIAAVVARCRLALMIQLLARWIADYLGKAYRLQWSALTPADVKRFRLDRPLEERLAPVAAAAASGRGAFDRLGAASPFLFRRVQFLAALCEKSARDRVLRRLEGELHILLPWVQTIRHGVAHLGSASFTGLDLVNQHLREYVTLCYDQLASSALQKQIATVGEVHSETIRDFDAMVDKLLSEPCLSVLHVRQGLNHTTALPAKFWAL